MKLSKILVATAAAVLASNVSAQATSGSNLNEKAGGTYLGALPVGIVANPLLRDALQGAQLDPSCVGNDSKTCMPSISTIELSSIMQAQFGVEWGNNYGLIAFGTGSTASPVVCGGIADQASRVAARHVGLGCTTANPDAAYNGIAGLFAIGGDAAACLTSTEGFGAGGIAFVTADQQDPAYRFVKLDGEAPDLANFVAGNYAMFADVHGGSLTGVETAQPFGNTGAVAAENNPPMHASAGSFTLSNECAAGRLRNNLNGDLVN